MSEPANEIKKDSLGLEGFETLLELNQATSEAVQNSAHEPAHEEAANAQEVETVVLEVPEGYWTTEEAARHLGISQRTVFKRLKDGSLKGLRVQGKFRQEWRIEPVYSSATLLEVVQEHDELIMNANDRPQELAHEEATNAPEPRSGSTVHLPELDRMLAVMREKDQLLQAATYRNGYLEAQLENRDREIKLLTDSQHQPSGWARFWSWFSGR